MGDFNAIYCNGMMGMWCKKCAYCPKYEVINDNEYIIECLALDIDGVQVIGKERQSED